MSDLFSRLLPLVESSLTVGFVISGVVVGFVLLGKVTKDIGTSFVGGKMGGVAPINPLDDATIQLIKYRLGVIEEELKAVAARVTLLDSVEIARRLNVIDQDIRRLEDALLIRK